MCDSINRNIPLMKPSFPKGIEKLSSGTENECNHSSDVRKKQDSIKKPSPKKED